MVGTRVPEETAKQINRAIEDGHYLTPSGFLKAAIDNELKRLYPE